MLIAKESKNTFSWFNMYICIHCNMHYYRPEMHVKGLSWLATRVSYKMEKKSKNTTMTHCRSDCEFCCSYATENSWYIKDTCIKKSTLENENSDVQFHHYQQNEQLQFI